MNTFHLKPAKSMRWSAHEQTLGRSRVCSPPRGADDVCRRPGGALSAIAVALVLAAGATTAMAQPMPGGPGMHGGHGMRAGPGMNEGRGGMGQHMLDAAGATPEQRAKVGEIMRAAHEDMRKQREANRTAHQQMAQLMAAPQIDAAAVESTRQRLSAQHDANSRRMTRAMLDASAVLTPEQRQKAAAQMSSRRDMVERHRRERDSIQPPRSN